MNKKIIILSLFLLSLSLVSATTLMISDKDDSTFELVDFIEKIQIENKDAFVKDLIKFKIRENSLNETLGFSLDISDISGVNFTISSFEFLYCSHDQIDSNSILWIYGMEKEWGLFCDNEIKGKKTYRMPSDIVNYELDLSKINWSETEKNLENRVVYLQIEYNIKDFVFENQGDYKFLWIEELYSNHRTFKSNANIVHTYVVLPSQDSILINPDNFEPKGFDSNGKLGLFYQNSEENSFLTYRDAKEEKNKRLFRDISLILITLGISVIVGFLASVQSSERTKVIWFLFAIFLIIFGSFLFLKESILHLLSIILFLLIFFSFLFGILSLKKDGRLFHFKRRFEDIKKFIIEIVNRVGFKGK